MPFGDGTGPNGLGPFTGRGRGFCIGTAGNSANIGLGRGRFSRVGRRNGRGNGGFGRLFDNVSRPLTYEISAEQELEILKNQAHLANANLGSIQQRINELEEIVSQKQ